MRSTILIYKLLVEIEQLRIENKDLFRKLNGAKSDLELEAAQYQN